MQEDIENKLKPEVKDFADWQVDVYFPMVYSHYNKTYQKIYRTNMPWSQFYAGCMSSLCVGGKRHPRRSTAQWHPMANHPQC